MPLQLCSSEHRSSSGQRLIRSANEALLDRSRLRPWPYSIAGVGRSGRTSRFPGHKDLRRNALFQTMEKRVTGRGSRRIDTLGGYNYHAELFRLVRNF
jgi:hypothetical protein